MTQYNSIVIVLLITIQILAACSGDGFFPTPTPDPESETARIYSLAINEAFGVSEKYLIHRFPGCSFTNAYSDLYQFEGVDSESLVDLFTKLEQFKTFPNMVQVDDRFIFVDEQDYWDTISSNDLPYSSTIGLNLELLTQTFPWADGIIHLSPVGFNQAHTQAVVCIGKNSGGWEEVMHKIVYEKKEDVWMEVWHEVVTEIA
jgi:hypothetical protein